jgi:hypothetical protein
VPALARGDPERLLRFVAEAESFGGDHPFEGEFLTQLRGLVPADWVHYAELPAWSLDDGWTLSFSRPGDLRSNDWDTALHAIHLAEDPIVLRWQEGAVGALKLSDFCTRRELQRTRLYNLTMKPYGHEDSLGLLLPIRPLSRPKGFSLDRGASTFSERDSAILGLLSPHLVRLYQANESRRQLREALALHESSRAGVVLLERDDCIAFASTAASELLERYFGKVAARLPDALSSWLRDAEERPLSRYRSSLISARSWSSSSTARCSSPSSGRCPGSHSGRGRFWTSSPRAGRTRRSRNGCGYRL